MAHVLITDDEVTVSLTTAEKVGAFHGSLTVPRSAITAVRVVPDGIAEIHGIRAPGSGMPGMIMVGTWRHPDGSTFAVCHGQRPAVVLDLAGTTYDRIVVTVDHPDQVARSLS